MILANVRQCLTRGDAQLAMRLVARGSSAELDRLEHALRDEGIDAILDDPRLRPAMLEQSQAAHASSRLFVYVVVRHALREVGEDDRTMADFVASVLLQFGDKDRARRIREYDDQVYDTLASLLADADSADPTRAFLVRVHLGHYALWLAGVFPDHIEHRRHRRGGPDLEYFDEMGRRGYQLAAEHRLASEHGVTALFEHAAERFGRLRFALNRVSDGVFFARHHTASKLMRQVRDEARWVS
ncbi:MAG: hypothetical protein IPF87_22250 [Gemmatimonadetes bacterium]|jgi:hypothetical protein|nr:hypothetical protein [Gemmatimonadota bacterium]MBP9106392.1 hypothetical protein [Gemmatimonadaceae bacterium]MBK6843683.1 hypothetical protein [Gemmatimonadota bacterium]MBK7833222.1 hypothetical protein [Gemmatimonadota bacterium]MBK8646586.1 hypothetical protein [Gemmatimonadota bacterium]